jgi:hypothetical protein
MKMNEMMLSWDAYNPLEYPKCELCEEYLDDIDQTTLIKAKSGYKPVHKVCVHQLTLGVWDELEARAKINMPLDKPYDNAHIANPVVRKSLGLDTPEWGRAIGIASYLTGGQDEAPLEEVLARIDNAARSR